MSGKEPVKIGEKWTVDRDPDEKSHYAADITQELIDRATTAVSVVLVLVGVVQLEDPQIQVAAMAAGWAVETYKQVAASAALRAANIAQAESEVAAAGAKVGQIGATQAMIVVARTEAMAKLASSNANVASARTAIAAAEAAGVQSFALYTVRLATAELAVAEAQRSAMLAELAILGRQQASVSTQMTAALAAQTAAQNALNGATAGGSVVAGVASRALGLLGGPVGAIITLLGIGAMAWQAWGDKGSEAEKKVTATLAEEIDDYLANLQKQIDKLKERNELAGKKLVSGAEPTTDLEKKREAIMGEINRIAKDTDLGVTAKTEILRVWGARLNKLTVEMEDFSAAQQKNKDITFDAKYADWLGKNGSAAQKEAYDLEQLRKEYGRVTPEMQKFVREKYADKGSKTEISEYGTLVVAIKEKIAASKQEAKGTADLTESQKLQIALNEKIKEGKLKLTPAHKAEYEALIKDLAVSEDAIATKKRMAEADKEGAEFNKRYSDGLEATSNILEKMVTDARAEADKNEEAAKTYGLSKTEIEKMTLARLEDQLAQRASLGLTLDEIETIEKMIAAKKRSVSALGRIDDLEAAKKAGEELDKFLDPTKAQSFGEALRTAFGSAGDSLTKLVGSLQQYGIKQAEIEKARVEASVALKGDKLTEQQYLDSVDQLHRRNTQNQLASYGDMAGAAAGFFNEHSRGYQALTAVSQAFHAAELAMTMAELVPKAISAVLTQGQGDPYTAFGRMAAMGALVAGLGVAIGGVSGGADTTAQDRQRAQGTGSILGDSDAKSESIKNALDLIDKNTYQDLAISGSMLATLRSIDSNIGAFASQLVRGTDITNPRVGLNTSNGLASTVGTVGLSAGGALLGMTGAAWTAAAGSGITASALASLGSAAGPVGAIAGAIVGMVASKIPAVSKLMTGVFGGKQSLQDSGFRMDAASLANILSSGAKAYQYADIKTSGGWFRSDKSSVQTNPLDEATNRQFTAVITSLADSITAAGGVLGLSGDAFANKLNSFVVDIGKVSLKDLKGDELQKAIESVFSKLGDDMAQFAVGGLAQFQDVGEGYLETLARISTEYQTVDVVFQSFGKTFNQVGMESIAARDRLVDLAGGLEKFTSQGEYFLANFFSDQEQAAALKKRIDPTLAQYGLSTDGEDANKMFRDFVLGLDETTAAGAQAYSVLMSIAPAFKQIVDANKDATEKVRDDQGDLLNLQAQTYDLLGDKVGAATVLEKQRAIALESLSPALAAATKELWAAQAAADAISKAQSSASSLMNSLDTAFSTLQSVVAREKTAIQSSIDVHTKSVTKLQSLSDSLHSTLDSIKGPDRGLVDRALGQAQIRAALAIAKAGGPLPGAESLKRALSDVTQDAASQFSSYTDYLRDLYQTQNDIASLAGITDDSLSVEEKSLDALNAQVKQLDLMVATAQAQMDVLKGASTTLLSIEQALGGFSLALAGAQRDPINAATAGITNAYQTALGRTPDAAGMEYWTKQAAGGESLSNIVKEIQGSMEAQVQGLYKELLGGRTADAAGLSYWLGSGQSIDAIRKQIMQSDEYKSKHPIPGFASGGMFGGGLRIVGENGPELEATGPARIWSSNQTAALLARAGSPADNAQALAAAVDRLTATVDRQQAVIVQQAEDVKQSRRETKRLADTVERLTRGGNYMPTKDVKEEA